MKRLLVFDFFRGPHSTGFAALRKSGEVKIAKIASNPIELFDTKRFNEALNGGMSTVFMGHNRLATKGSINHNNAHPWTFGHITGCHNGTLEKESWDAIEEKLGEKFEVDSMAVIAAIAKLGIEDTVPLLQGAWALVWIDAADNSLNFLRNNERPFWFAFNDKLDRIFWASEHWTIQAAVQGDGSHNFYIDKEKSARFYSSQVDWWYRVDIAELAKGGSERPKMKCKILKGKEPKPVVTHYNGSPFPGRGGPHGKTTSTGSGIGHNSNVHSFTPVKKSNNKRNVLEYTTTDEHPYGDFLSKQEFDMIAAYGCSYCPNDVDYKDYGITVYADRSQVLCAECSCAGTRNRVYIHPNKFALIS